MSDLEEMLERAENPSLEDENKLLLVDNKMLTRRVRELEKLLAEARAANERVVVQREAAVEALISISTRMDTPTLEANPELIEAIVVSTMRARG